MASNFPEEWKLSSIENTMEAILDYRGKTPKKTSYGIPLITAKIVKDGRILPIEEYIDSNDYNLWMRRGYPKSGDIVMTTEAPLGEIAQLDDRKVALAQRLITLRGKPRVLFNSFLKYVMLSDFVQSQLKARATGTTVIGIKQKELRKVTIPLPQLDEQRAIAHILGTLDDKIELNHQMNETLEVIARAIFKSWFVDFDPVRAKAEGRDPGLPPDIAALFPDSFEDSELGLIPKGWTVGTIGDIGENPRRVIKPTELAKDMPYIGLEHMPRRCIALSEWGSAENITSNKSYFYKSEILFGKLRPYFHKVGVPPVDGVCSTDILVIAPKSQIWFGFLLGHLSNDDLVSYASAASTGTKMPRTSWKDIARYKVVVPPVPIASTFDLYARPYVNYIHANIHHSHTLAAVRDALLPKLLSGELRVPDVETFKEEYI